MSDKQQEGRNSVIALVGQSPSSGAHNDITSQGMISDNIDDHNIISSSPNVSVTGEGIGAPVGISSRDDIFSSQYDRSEATHVSLSAPNVSNNSPNVISSAPSDVNISPNVTPAAPRDGGQGPSTSRGLCPVCQEATASHRHYGGISCLSCKAFFR